jgi:hypothetical protein
MSAVFPVRHLAASVHAGFFKQLDRALRPATGCALAERRQTGEHRFPGGWLRRGGQCRLENLAVFSLCRPSMLGGSDAKCPHDRLIEFSNR